MNSFTAFLRLIRLPNLLIIALLQYAVRFGIIYPVLYINNFHLALSELDFFMISLATIMIAAAGYIINDYFDAKADRINKPQRVVIDKYIKRRVAMGAHIVINILAMIIAVYEAYKVGMMEIAFIFALSAGLLWYYSISFKRQVLIGNIVIAILAAMVPIIAGVFELLALKEDAYYQIHNFIFTQSTEMHKYTYDELAQLFLINFKMFWKWIFALSGFAFLTTLIRELIKDVEDIEGDEYAGSQTFPIVFGTQKTVRLISFLLFIVFVFVVLYERYLIENKNLIGAVYILITIIIPIVLMYLKLKSAKEKNDFTQLSLWAKLLILSGVVYPFVFGFNLLYFS